MTDQAINPTPENELTEQQLLDQLMLAWRTLSLAQKRTVVATANTLDLLTSMEKSKH